VGGRPSRPAVGNHRPAEAKGNHLPLGNHRPAETEGNHPPEAEVEADTRRVEAAAADSYQEVAVDRSWTPSGHESAGNERAYPNLSVP
jgi:hypothetical protein